MASMDGYSHDRVVQFVTAAARQRLGPVRVYLFGSRMRGTARRNSDYDFAIDVSAAQVSDRDWTAFLVYLDETAPTLNRLDVINLSAAIDAPLREEIERTAICVESGTL